MACRICIKSAAIVLFGWCVGFLNLLTNQIAIRRPRKKKKKSRNMEDKVLVKSTRIYGNL